MTCEHCDDGNPVVLGDYCQLCVDEEGLVGCSGCEEPFAPVDDEETCADCYQDAVDREQLERDHSVAVIG